METFSTAGVLQQRKADYWNELACDTFLPSFSQPNDPHGFFGSIKRAQLSGLLMAEVQADELVSHHSPLHVAQMREQFFFVHLQLQGVSVNYQAGRETVLEAGDFSLGDSSRPSRKTLFGGRNQFLMLRVPAQILRRHLPFPERLVGIGIPGRTGLGAVTASFMLDFWRRQADEMPESALARVMPVLLEMIASTYAHVAPAQTEGVSLATGHRLRIASYVEAHLADPNLSVARIAAAYKMTSRHLHHLFSHEDETVSRYILRRRLERSAIALASASQRSRTITAVALDHGFSNLTHFGKVFRERYGMTPIEYRRMHSPEP